MALLLLKENNRITTTTKNKPATAKGKKLWKLPITVQFKWLRAIWWCSKEIIGGCSCDYPKLQASSANLVTHYAPASGNTHKIYVC
jgi:hypothetical protein